MTAQEIQQQALTRAQDNSSMKNYPTIFQGFIAKGINENDIIPRENVLTFHAWKAKGRYVRKNEHGVKVTTWIAMEKKVDDNDSTDLDVAKVERFRRPKSATVFHVSQTDKI